MPTWLCGSLELLRNSGPEKGNGLASSERESAVVRLWRDWHEEGRPIVAPTLLQSEVSNALHRYVVHGVYLPEEAAELFNVALGLRITANEARSHFGEVLRRVAEGEQVIVERDGRPLHIPLQPHRVIRA